MGPVPWPKAAKSRAETSRKGVVLYSNIMCVVEDLTVFRVSKLPAGYSSINSSPEVVTDCAPHTINTDLDSAFISRSSSTQSNVTSFALFLTLNTHIITVSTGANIEETITGTV